MKHLKWAMCYCDAARTAANLFATGFTSGPAQCFFPGIHKQHKEQELAAERDPAVFIDIKTVALEEEVLEYHARILQMFSCTA